MVMIAAIARAARSGVLVKGGLHLEALAQVDTVVFDKTGTLTIGEPKVSGTVVLDPAFTEADLARLAAAADRRSAHPLAEAVVEHAASVGIDVPDPTAFETLDGRGVAATVDVSKIVFARAIARRAHRTIKENLFVGVGVVHVLGITAALLGLIGPVQAAIIHLGPDVLVFLNSTELLRVRIDTGETRLARAA